jgi:hypothetical protein
MVALNRNGFRLRKEDRSNEEILIRAVRGSRFFYLLHQYIPFSSWFKELQRYGCEARFWKVKDEIRAEVYIVPYMEIVDREEIFILTQDYIERHVDERFSDELWDMVFDNLTLQWQPTRQFDTIQKPELAARDGAVEYSHSCPPRYNPKYCPYCKHCLPKQDRKYCDRHGIYL